MSRVEDRLRLAGMSEEGARSRAAMFARVEAALRDRGIEPSSRFHVPGRIEVLGKHTDYAGGRSLLAAVERGFCVAFAPRRDGRVRILDVGRSDEIALSLDPAERPLSPHWAIYPAAVTRRLARDFEGPLLGADIALLSDLPPSSGLSSSSALLIATFEALRASNRLEAREDFARALPGVLDVAAYLGSVESGRPFRGFGGEAGVGTAGGSQDHTAILASEAGRLCRFGFAPVRAEGSVSLPKEVTFVVAVSGVVAQKTAGAREAYNRAAALSSAILGEWCAMSGRDDRTLFEAVTSSPDAHLRLREALGSSSGAFEASALQARLEQFVDESLILIPAAFDALGAGDLEAFGRAVDRSQRGAEAGLANQVKETVSLQRLARSLGAYAASAFGAGFGGSVWSLVSRDQAAAFMAEWELEYRRGHEHPGSVFFRTDAGPPLLHLSD
ncbi:MAG: galactokinase family protein [Vicinamibacteria bacterium]